MKKKFAYGVTGLILGCIFLVSDLYFDYEFRLRRPRGIFTDVLGFPAKGTFTLENYKNAFQELDYIRSFMNSLLITVVTAVLVLLISAMAAWVLVRYKTKASKIIFFDICRFYVDSISVCHASIGWICKQNRFAVSWWLDLYVYGLSNKYGNHNVSWVHKKYSGGIGGSRYN